MKEWRQKALPCRHTWRKEFGISSWEASTSQEKSVWSCSKRFVSYFESVCPIQIKHSFTTGKKSFKWSEVLRARSTRDIEHTSSSHAPASGLRRLSPAGDLKSSTETTEQHNCQTAPWTSRQTWTGVPQPSSNKYRAKSCQVLAGTAKNSSKDSHGQLQWSHPLLLASNIRKATTEVKREEVISNH